MESQEAKVFLKPGEKLDPPALREAVKKADFTPQRVRVTAKGELLSYSDGLALKIPETGQMFILIPTVVEEKKEPGENDKLAELKAAFKNGLNKAIVSGTVSEDEELPLKLSVEKYELVRENDDK